MARLSTIFSTASGSVGNVTMRSTKTAQGTRAIVASSKVTSETQTNPRTTAQMTQRAKFATAVKFYKRATQNFFKFAFEDKKANESDYNAFMRHNIAAALPMNKYQINNAVFPAIANRWMLADGSLPQVPLVGDSEIDSFILSGVQVLDTDYVLSGSNFETVGTLSAALIRFGFSVGDIVTLVFVTSDLAGDDVYNNTEESINSVTAGLAVPSWCVCQFVINISDVTLLRDINRLGTLPNGADNILKISSSDGSVRISTDVVSVNSAGIQGVSIIVTRHKENSRDLYASPAWLVGTAGFDTAVANIGSERYVTNMLLSWGADTSTAILAGYIAGGSSSVDVVEGDPTITAVNGSAVPAALGTVAGGTTETLTLTGTNLTSEHEVSENSFSFTGSGASVMSVQSFTVNSSQSATLVLKNGNTGSSNLDFSLVASLYKDGSNVDTIIATGTAGANDA